MNESPPADSLQSSSPSTFREVQFFFDNLVLRLLVGLVLLSLFGASIWKPELGEATDSVHAVGATILVMLLVCRMRLVTQVTGETVTVRLWPFPSKTYAFSDVDSAVVRRYRPLGEYGGWGLRLGTGGVAWNAYGDRGVELVLKNGKRVLVGSQDSQRLAEVVSASLR